MSDMTDAELYAAVDEVDRLRAQLAKLPPCLTCGGTALIPASSNWAESTGLAEKPCPDCKDHPGKASIEQVVALWNDWHDLALSLTNVTEQHPRRT